ncbi:FCD domain-containing protein [candidate division KSB1 bacterium]|nr:FCD domain-containing protein [candidate division KSB1 bacterium]
MQANLEQFVNREQEVDEIALLDVEFHMAISHACGNPLIPLIMDPLFSMLPKVKTLIVTHLKKIKKDNAVYDHQ